MERNKGVTVKSWLAFVVAAASAAVIVVGCGGEDGDSQAAAGEENPIQTSSLSKSEFIERANVACRRTKRKLVGEAVAYLESHKGKPESVVLADLGREVLLPKAEAQLAAIRKLGAPEGDEEELEEIMAIEREEIARVRGLKKAESTFTLSKAFEGSSERFKEYGLHGCANGP